jgi:uncharacterized membrane protein
LAYPFAVYFGLEHIGAKGFALGLLALFALRFCFAKRASSLQSGYLLAAVAIFAAFVYSQNSTQALRFYPVLINSALFLLFSYSLFSPPPMIERLARISEPDLPPNAIAYTRKVTYVWCGFFLINGAIAAYTAQFSSLQVWSLYNGLIAYFLMAALFVIEYAVRTVFKRRDARQCQEK